MKLLKFFYYRVLLLTLLIFLGSWNTVECVSIGVSIEVTNTTGNASNGIVKLIFSDSSADFNTYIIVNGKKEKIRDNKTSSLAKGKYDVIVTGKTPETKYCPKYFAVVIN